MNKLRAVIREAKEHRDKFYRNTVIFVPTELIDEAFKYFTEGFAIKQSRYYGWGVTLKLNAAVISGQSDIHYDTVYVINPGDIEERVLNELKMVPTDDAIVYHVSIK